MQLNTVVLPAPFGPMSAVMSPRPAWNERSLTATRPPKRMVRCCTSRTGSFVQRIASGDWVMDAEVAISRAPPSGTNPQLAGTGRTSAVPLLHEGARDGLALLEDHGGLPLRDQAARTPDHQGDHAEAEQEEAVLVGVEALAEDRREEAEVAQH